MPETHSNPPSTIAVRRLVPSLGVLTTMLCAASAILPAQKPPQAVSLLEQAALARDSNDIPSALVLYERSAALNPTSSEAWWFLGFLHYQRDEYAPARDAFTHFLALIPKAGPASALRGLCEFELGELPAALADLQAGLAAGAGNTPRSLQTLRFHEAQILALSGQFEAARASYAAAAQAGPLQPLMQVGLGLAGLRIPHLPSAIPDSEKPMLATLGEAEALLLIGKTDEGDAAFQAFFQHYPSVPNSHYLLGYLLFTNEPARAIAEFQLELAVSPHSAPAKSMLAWAYLSQGVSDRALSYAQQAVEDAPTDSFAQLVLGRALVDTGAAAAGLPHLTLAEARDPANLDIHLALAKAYSETSKPSEARTERIRSLELSAREAPTNDTSSKQEPAPRVQP